MSEDRLKREFYLQETIEVARQLIGHELVVESPVYGVLSGIIVETEAYLGAQDPSCHSFNNCRTSRTETMFWSGGYSYVYFIYGMYHCFNIVTMDEEHPEAVLIRALQPRQGIKALQRQAKPGTPVHQLLNGPGKLCKAMGIDRSFNAQDLCQSLIYVRPCEEKQKFEIVTTPRIGIGSSGDAAYWPLRFYWKDHLCVSPVKTPVY